MNFRMSILLALLSICLLGATAPSAPAPASMSASTSEITLPVRFHIVTDMTMHKDGLAMASWVSESDIREIILPEVNRIWAPANIAFSAATIIHHRSVDHPDKQALIDYIVNAKRNAQGRSDPRRIAKLNQLIDWELHNDMMINVYLVPYLGERSQGNARRRIKRIFVGQYSDKASRARRLPVAFQLTESRPFGKGSLSRTLAHEIGHILRLSHPDRGTQTTFGQLMGGRKPGYALTPENIATARTTAQAF